MNEQRFREKFERTEENEGRLGVNTGAIDCIIDFTNFSNDKCKDGEVSFFLNNLDEINKIRPNFIIFYTDDGPVGFQYLFSSLNLKRSLDDLVIGHELGHVLNSIKNVIMPNPNRIRYEVVLPDNFSEIIARAKENCLSSQNREEIKSYIERLCKSQDISQAERGPVADIFSAAFQAPYVYVGSKDNKCTFPSTHRKFYDIKEYNDSERLQYRFDETFANIFTLIANGCGEELAMLTHFMGEEYIGLFVEEIHQSVQKYRSGIGHSDPQKSSLDAEATKEEEFSL